MSKNSNHLQVKNDEDIDLFEIFEKLNRGRNTIFIITIASSLFGLLIGKMMTPSYQSEIVIAPTAQQQQTAASSMFSQLGPLAQSFGMGNVGQTTDDKVALAIYKSKPFTSRLFSNDDLLSMMFKDRWKTDNKCWIDGERPSDIAINSRFRRMLKIQEDPNTKTLLITITHEHPILAAEVANQSIDELNDFIREKAIKESNESQKYLNDTLALTTIVDVKNVIYNLIEEQIKTSMLTNVRKEFVFKVIDHASVASSPVKPNITFIMFFFTLFGLILSSVYVYLTGLFKESNEHT